MNSWSDVFKESLVLAADIGITLLFYKLYKNKCDTAEQIEAFEPIQVGDLKQVVHRQPGGTLQYGLVEGLAHPVGKPLKSQFTDDVGSIKHLKRVVHKSERIRGYWANNSSVVSEVYDKVPFALFDTAGGSSVLVTDPQSAECLSDALHTTYDDFEPSKRSITESVFDRLVGEITKGYQTTEQILRTGTPLLGLGKIVSNGGSLELRKPTIPSAPYIVTSMSKEELVTYVRKRATMFKVLAGIFGVTGLLIFWVVTRRRIHEWYQNYRRRAALDDVRQQIAQMREVVPPASQAPEGNETAADASNACVICWVNSRELANRPCGHVCSCMSCYEAMPYPKQCPVCRQAIDEIIPIFIA